MAKEIEQVNQMCGCSMPVVPTIFPSGCLTLPEQVGKLTKTTNEVVQQTNANTQEVASLGSTVSGFAAELDEITTTVPKLVEEAIAETGSPFIAGNYIDGVEFTGKEAITHYALCQTAIDASAKVISTSINESTAPVSGAILAVQFLYGSDNISGATLAYDGGEAYRIVNGTSAEIPKVQTGGYVIFNFTGTSWNVVASGESTEAERLSPGNTINGAMFTGAKPITMQCYTTTTASSNNKIIIPQNSDGVNVQNGAVVLVRFVNGNTYEGTTYFTMGNASNPAVPVYYNGTTAGLPQIPPNGFMLFAYYNSAWYGALLQSTGGATSSYVLPAASRTSLGGVIIGEGINLNTDGTISVSAGQSYVLPIASAGELGGIKIGDGLEVESDGTVNVTVQAGTTYTLPAATASTLGGVKIGSNVSVSGDGTISVAYPAGSKSQAGIVKVGDNINVSSGTITVPKATAGGSAGVVEIPSSGSVTVDSNGEIAVNAGSEFSTSGALSLNVNSTGGLQKTTSGLGIKLNEPSGLLLGSDGLSLNIDYVSNEGQVTLTATESGEIATNLFMTYDSDTKTLNIVTTAG